MIGFSIFMWFISIILLILSISLLRGNTSSIHGKLFEQTEDKIGLGKSFGKVTLFLSLGIACCGGIALTGTSSNGIRNVMFLFIPMLLIAILCFIHIHKKYTQKK